MSDTKFFAKEVDMNNRKSMIDFLTNHFRYDTLNSWNQSTSYANNVKIYNLNIPDELREKAYDILDVQNNELEWLVREQFNDFYEKTGYFAGFNGRSGGYIVMYETETEQKKDGQQRIAIYHGRQIDMYADFEDEDEWSMSDLQQRVKEVQAFDEMCDNIRDAFIQLLKEYDIVEEEQTVRVKRKVIKKKGSTDEN